MTKMLEAMKSTITDSLELKHALPADSYVLRAYYRGMVIGVLTTAAHYGLSRDEYMELQGHFEREKARFD